MDVSTRVDFIWGVIAVLGSVGGVAWLLWSQRHDTDREDEDDARAFYAEHGRWPDQTAEEAEAEREVIARAAPVGVGEGVIVEDAPRPPVRRGPLGRWRARRS